MSTLYTAALILHPSRRTRYIKVNQLKKWIKPTLEKVIKLWEDYRETAPTPTPLIILSYGRRAKELRELNTFNRITQSLKQVARLVS